MREYAYINIHNNTYIVMSEGIAIKYENEIPCEFYIGKNIVDNGFRNPDYNCGDKIIPQQEKYWLRITLIKFIHLFKDTFEPIDNNNYVKINDNNISSFVYENGNYINVETRKYLNYYITDRSGYNLKPSELDTINNEIAVLNMINLSNKQKYRIKEIKKEIKKVRNILQEIKDKDIINKLNYKNKHLDHTKFDFNTQDNNTCGIFLTTHFIFNTYENYIDSINFIKTHCKTAKKICNPTQDIYAQIKKNIKEVNENKQNLKWPIGFSDQVRKIIYSYILATIINKLKMYIVCLNQSINNITIDNKYLTDEYCYNNIVENFIKKEPSYRRKEIINNGGTIKKKGFGSTYKLKCNNICGIVRNGSVYNYPNCYILCEDGNEWNIFIDSPDVTVNITETIKHINTLCKYNDTIRELNSNADNTWRSWLTYKNKNNFRSHQQ